MADTDTPTPKRPRPAISLALAMGAGAAIGSFATPRQVVVEGPPPVVDETAGLVCFPFGPQLPDGGFGELCRASWADGGVPAAPGAADGIDLDPPGGTP